MHQILLGLSAALAAVLIGAGWQVVTRFGVTTTVSSFDLALIRYCVPALLLSPILWREGFYPKGVSSPLLIAILLGGGLPYGLLVMMGAQFAPISHIAVLIPGTMPLFVMGLAAVFLGETLTRQKALRAAFLLVGVGCVGWEAVVTMGTQTIWGDAMLVLAAFLWGIYSVAFRHSAIAPWHGAALICFWSAVLIVPIWVVKQEGGLAQTAPMHLLIQFVWQGVLAGAVGMWVYGYAMQQIGAANAASVGALVPGLAGLGGWIILGEVLSPLACVGIGMTVLGVVISNLQRAA